MRWALIQNGVVANVVEQDSAPTIEGTWVQTVLAGPGWTYDGDFHPPVDSRPRHVTRLAFLNRFTDAEAIAIDLASIGATVQAASMRRYMQKVNNSAYIDLDRADTRSGVQALEAGGVLAAGRAATILDAEVQESERPQ